MAKKELSFEELEKQITSLPYDKFRRLMIGYAKTTGTDICKLDDEITYGDFQKRMEVLHINDCCPFCGSINVRKNGKRNSGLQRYKCNDCEKRFTRLTNTILDKTRWHYQLWIEMVYMILNEFSIVDMQNLLEKDYACYGLNKKTIMLWREKIMHAMASVPMPVLSGVIQVDETFIRESQKGSKHLESYIKGEERLPHRGPVTSKYGVLGPEFATVTTAVDSRGYCVCYVACMGQLKADVFFDLFDNHFESVSYLCSDANSIYQKYCNLRHIPHYVRPSNYLDELKRNGYVMASEPGHNKTANREIEKKLYSEGLIDEIVIDGIQIRDFDTFAEIKYENSLSLARVNQLHSDIKLYINKIKRNVTTKNLADYIGAFTYLRNWKAAHGYYAVSKKDAEEILVELIATRTNITITESTDKKLALPKPSGQYVRVLKEETEKARKASKNGFFKFHSDDGFESFQTKPFLNQLPTYRLKELAKRCKIKRYTTMTNYQLVSSLLKVPDIEKTIYEFVNDIRNEKIDEEDLRVNKAKTYAAEKRKISDK